MICKIILAKLDALDMLQIVYLVWSSHRMPCISNLSTIVGEYSQTLENFNTLRPGIQDLDAVAESK